MRNNNLLEIVAQFFMWLMLLDRRLLNNARLHKLFSKAFAYRATRRMKREGTHGH